MPSRIVRRIEAESGIAGLHDALAEKLPPTDFQSLLMEVCRTRAVRRKASELAAQFARDPLLAPSAVSARVLLEFDRIAFEAAAGFDALDLSPACPFGASHLLGGTSQNNVLTAIRNVETLGDSTIAMAFEAARRRRLKQTAQLCASHRVVRFQPVDVPTPAMRHSNGKRSSHCAPSFRKPYFA